MPFPSAPPPWPRRPGRKKNKAINAPGRFPRFAVALLAAGAFAGCGTYSEVRETRPAFRPVPAGTGALVQAEAEIDKGLRQDRRDPVAALDEFLAAAKTAEEQLRRDPGDAAAKRDYNFAVSRTMEIIRDAKLDPWSKPLPVRGRYGHFVLTHRSDSRPEWNPALYDFTPADRFEVRGRYVTRRTVRAGLGAPLVAVERAPNAKARADFAPSRAFDGLTALARFEGQRCTLSFADPLSVETVALAGHTFPLAADFTAPLAVMLERTDPKKHELARLLNPEKYAHTAAIERLQPYDPNKTIVLVIHGLMDSQATWTPMINALRGDPLIRRHYQFWFYSYPSGYPYPYSAAILRSELDAVEQRFPGRKPMVVLGHSMGGCISRLLITDGGGRLWMQIFGKAPEEVPLSPRTRALFTQELFFRHRPEVGCVIFIAAPLRGSNLASSWLGRLGSSLIRAPRALRAAGREVVGITDVKEGELKLKRLPNSVDTLAPNSRFVKAINAIPLTPGVPYYTIVGDRGKGDSPNSSDGVVPYWSAHLDGAKVERIVPSGHGAHQDPQAIEEVRRILTGFAPSRGRSTPPSWGQ
jgi:pimeloyl-ACP methyl ester carboxylesterase